MKTLEQVVEERARAEAEAVRAEARRAAEAHWERESARMRREHERRCESTRAELQAALDQEMSAIESGNRVAVLARKNELIDHAFQAAMQKIVSLPNDYRAWLLAQLSRLPVEDSFELMVNPRDRAVVSELLRQTRRSNLRLSSRSCFLKGGFIASGKLSDKDCSVETAMDVVRDALAERIVAMLFEEGAS